MCPNLSYLSIILGLSLNRYPSKSSLLLRHSCRWHHVTSPQQISLNLKHEWLRWVSLSPEWDYLRWCHMDFPAKMATKGTRQALRGDNHIKLGNHTWLYAVSVLDFTPFSFVGTTISRPHYFPELLCFGAPSCRRFPHHYLGIIFIVYLEHII